MTKRKLPKAADWQARDLNDWNTTTFRTYIADRHSELYGIAYVTRSYSAEAGMLKRMLEDHGPVALKAFIDLCFADYKPTRQYPGLNFSFMYAYMRTRNLPRVLADIKRMEAAKETPAETGGNEIEEKGWW